MGGYQFLPSFSSMTTRPDPVAYDALKNFLGRAESVSNTPYEQYGGQLVANFAPDQLNAFQNVRGLQGIWQPYIDQSRGLITNSVDMLGRNYGQTINQYMDPYISNVVNATMANARESNAQQQNKLTSNAIMNGGMGGDRLGVMRAELSRQQNLANNDLVSKLYSGAYGQAAGMAQNAAGLNMNAASGIAGLGNQALTSGLQGANALLQSGNQQQALNQKNLEAQYQLWNQAKQFPYAQTQWLGSMVTGAAPAMGSNTSGWSIQPYQNQSQGNGAAGIMGAITGGIGAISQLPFASILPALGLSDEREKTDIHRVGKDKATGLDLYAYRYKGDPKTYPKVVGPMAQDVEERYPDAVHDVAGRKAVNYDRIGKAGGGALDMLYGGGMSYVPATEMAPARPPQEHKLQLGPGQAGGSAPPRSSGLGDIGSQMGNLAKGLGKMFDKKPGAPTQLPGAATSTPAGDTMPIAPDASAATGATPPAWSGVQQLPPIEIGKPNPGLGQMPGSAPIMSADNFSPFKLYADGGRVCRAEGGGLTADELYQYLASQGATPGEATLLAGNAGVESEYDPTKIHDHGSGYGLFGHRLDRLQAMQQYAGGVEHPSWQQQAAFALDELRHRPEHRGLDVASSPEAIALAGMHYERPYGYTQKNPTAAPSYDDRLARIRDLWSRYGSQGPVATSDLGSAPESFFGLFPQAAATGGRIRDAYATGGGDDAGDDQQKGLRIPAAVASHPQAQKIAMWANERGLDPYQAVAVAHSEGLMNPVGDSGKSLSDFQLYTGGGWGNDFEKETGIRLTPQNVGQYRDMADKWALDRVKREGGFRPEIFHGMNNSVYAKDMGLTSSAGVAPIRVADAGTSDASPGLQALYKAMQAGDKTGDKEESYKGLLPPNVGQALMAAGFGMMASPRRDFLGAVGEGGLAGLQAYGAAEKGDIDRETHKAQLENYKSESRHRDFENAYKVFQMEQRMKFLKSLEGGAGPSAGAQGASALGSAPTAKDAPGAPVDLTQGPLIEGRSTGQGAPAPAPAANPFGELETLNREHDRLSRIAMNAPDSETRAAAEARIKGIEWQIQQAHDRVVDVPKEDYPKLNIDPTYSGPVQRKYTGEITMPGKPQVSIDQRAETAQKTEMGKKYAETFFDLRKQGNAAGQTIQTLNQMKRLADDPNFYSGAGGDAFKKAKQIGVALGLVDPEAAAPAEMFQSLSNRLVLSATNGSLGAGISNADVSFLQRQNPNIAMTPAANKAMIDIGIKLAQRQQEIQRMAIKYAGEHGGLDPSFDAMVMDYAEAHPIIGDAEKAALSGAAAPDARQPGMATGLRQQQGEQRLPPPPPGLAEKARQALKNGWSREQIVDEFRRKGQYDPSAIFAQ